MTRAFGRLGHFGDGTEKRMLFIVREASGFTHLAPLIAALRKRYPRLPLALGIQDRKCSGNQWSSVPEIEVLELPRNNRIAAMAFLSRANVMLAAFVEDAGGDMDALVAALKARASAVVAISAHGAEAPELPDVLAKACERRLLVGHGEDQLPPEAAAEILDGLLLRAIKQRGLMRAERPGVGRWLARLTRDPARRQLLAWRLRRYVNADELVDALDRPQTILCLGNGPSSEDSALFDMHYDALFRVNHRWLERGLFVEPDVVFTGGLPTLWKIRDAVFGLKTRNAEAKLAAIRILDPFAGQSRFFNVHDMTPELENFEWGAFRPTNGAAMVAAAVALKPSRLIVAGIDLFQHPAGSYPNDAEMENAYAPGHGRDAECRFLMQLFDTFRGELIIVGDVLRAQRETYRKPGVQNVEQDGTVEVGAQGGR